MSDAVGDRYDILRSLGYEITTCCKCGKPGYYSSHDACFIHDPPAWGKSYEEVFTKTICNHDGDVLWVIPMPEEELDISDYDNGYYCEKPKWFAGS
jgi:hypothetical protein